MHMHFLLIQNCLENVPLRPYGHSNVLLFSIRADKMTSRFIPISTQPEVKIVNKARQD